MKRDDEDEWLRSKRRQGPFIEWRCLSRPSLSLTRRVDEVWCDEQSPRLVNSSLGCRRGVMQCPRRRAHDGKRGLEERRNSGPMCSCFLTIIISLIAHMKATTLFETALLAAPTLRSVSRLVLFHRTWEHGFLCCPIRHLAPHPRSVSRRSTGMALNLVLCDVSSASVSRSLAASGSSQPSSGSPPADWACQGT
jgi:hypothetical protein